MSDKNICLSRRTKTERKERGMLNVDYLVLDKHIWLWPKYQVNTSGSNNCFNVVSSTKCVSVYKNYDKVLPWRIKRWDTGKIVSLNTEKVGLSLTSMSTAVTRSSSQLDLCSFQLRKHLMISSLLFSGSVSVTCPLIDTWEQKESCQSLLECLNMKITDWSRQTIDCVSVLLVLRHLGV